MGGNLILKIYLKEYCSIDKYLSGFAIDNLNKNLYLFAVNIKEYEKESKVNYIKKNRLVGIKKSQYKDLLKSIENKFKKERLRLLLKNVEGENRNTYIIKLSINIYSMIQLFFEIDELSQKKVLFELNFNALFTSQSEFTQALGELILKGLTNQDGYEIEILKGKITNLVKDESTLFIKVIRKNYVFEIHRFKKDIHNEGEGFPLFKILSYGRKSKELLPKPNANFGVDADDHGSNMGWHFHYKIKKKGAKDLVRSFYLLTFEPDASLNIIAEPPLYWEIHGENKYERITRPKRSNRISIYQKCNNFRKKVKQENFKSIKQVNYQMWDKNHLFTDK
ncbi:hypothetical protein ACQCVE_04485 [Metabacillus sp. 113a]|uniref:hypothetical protein n=1 Tax=Metabacillus sp. 113a TaxID=3404706 RepID=UPI003CE8A930